MSTVRTRFAQVDRARIRFAMGDPDLGDLVYNCLSSQTGGVDVPNAFNGLSAPGSISGANIVAREFAYGNQHFTRLTLASRSVGMTDQAGVVAYGGTKLYTFPAGVIRITGFSVNLTVTKSGAGINADFDGDWSAGTVTASNNATLTGTEANVAPSASTPQAVAGVTSISSAALAAITALTDNTGGAVSNTIANTTGSGGAPTIAEFEAAVASLASKINEILANTSGSMSKSFDGTATAIDLYLNTLVDDADQDITGSGAAAALLLTGTIDLSWANLGDV